MKLRAGLMLGTAFVIGLGAGVLMMSSRPAMSQADPNSDVYQQLGLFSDIFGRVKADYVVPEKSEKLVYDAINGMLTGLDPHS
ncbi:MAG TPA: peptidase S41, partial [Acetobacteraceae bacterium]|nr:peptidase S41 [Acetobacteraceae bacterium]